MDTPPINFLSGSLWRNSKWTCFNTHAFFKLFVCVCTFIFFKLVLRQVIVKSLNRNTDSDKYWIKIAMEYCFFSTWGKFVQNNHFYGRRNLKFYNCLHFLPVVEWIDRSWKMHRTSYAIIHNLVIFWDQVNVMKNKTGVVVGLCLTVRNVVEHPLVERFCVSLKKLYTTEINISEKNLKNNFRTCIAPTG